MIDPIEDDPAIGILDSKLTTEDLGLLNKCGNILEKALDNSSSLEEVKIIEDVYSMNVSEAFERYNAIALGLPRMRLDLFYSDGSTTMTAIEKENANGIPEKEAKEESLD